MLKFAVTYPDEQFMQQAVAQMPWGYTIVFLDKFSDKVFGIGIFKALSFFLLLCYSLFKMR